jgi:hypothetical protein
MKVVRFSALSTGHLHSPENIPSTHFCLKAESTLEPECSLKDDLMKNSNDTNTNQTRDLSACSTLPKPTVPPRAPKLLAAVLNTLLQSF